MCLIMHVSCRGGKKKEEEEEVIDSLPTCTDVQLRLPHNSSYKNMVAMVKYNMLR